MAELKTYKRAAKIANILFSAIVVILILAGLFYWIYEEAAQRLMYEPGNFLASNKFLEARMVLLVSYIMTLLFLVIIQLCIQIAKEPHDDHIGPRRMVWSVFGGLLVLCYLTVALMAGTYKTDLKILRESMQEDLMQPYYYEFPGNFSESGKTFNRIQSTYKCCGAAGISDYKMAVTNHNVSLPYSCCELKESSKAGEEVNQEDVHDVGACLENVEGPDFKSGCEEIISSFTSDKANELVVIGALGAVIVFVGVVLRLALGYAYQRMKKQRKSYTVTESEDASGKEPIPLVTKEAANGENADLEQA